MAVVVQCVHYMRNKRGLQIAGRAVGAGQPVFVIAEVGVNHNGSIARAKKLIDAAVAAKADAVKFQMCDPDEMVVRAAPKAAYQEKTAKGESHYDMLKRLYFGVEEHKILKEYAKKKNIILFSTPFSIKDARELIRLRMPALKIGSSDTNNIPQLRVIAHANVPVILSTGMSDLAEVARSVAEIRKAGNTKLVVLQCTTQYPAEDANANLRAMATMRKALKVPIGLSDHTRGTEISLAAVALGACMIEKHITLDKKMSGPDHFASLEPQEFAAMVHGIRRVEAALGSDKKKLTPDERVIAKVARKSIVAARNIKKGERITQESLAYKRPGTGLSPAESARLIGKRARRAIRVDEMFSCAMVI